MPRGARPTSRPLQLAVSLQQACTLVGEWNQIRIRTWPICPTTSAICSGTMPKVSAERTATHQHLLSKGYIEERSVNLQDLLIIVTEAGRTALSSRGN